MGDDPGGRVDGDDTACVEDRDPIGEALGLLHQVGDQQDGHAPVADRLDQLPRLAAGLRIEARWTARRGWRPAACRRAPSAIESRCFWPPDRLRYAVSRLSLEPEVVDAAPRDRPGRA